MTAETRQLHRSNATLNENSFRPLLDSTDTKSGDQMKAVLESSSPLDRQAPQTEGSVAQLEKEFVASQGLSSSSIDSSSQHSFNNMLYLQSLKVLVKASEWEVEENCKKIAQIKEKIAVTRKKYLYMREDLECGESTLIRMGRLKEADRTFFEEKTPELDKDIDLLASLTSEETLVIEELSDEDLFRDQLRSLQSESRSLEKIKSSLDAELNELEVGIERIHQKLLDRTRMFLP